MVIVAVVFYFLKIKDFDDEPEPVVYRKRTVPSSTQTDIRRTQTTRPQGARPQSSQGVQRPQSSQNAQRPHSSQNGTATRQPSPQQSMAQRPQGNVTARPANNPERQKPSWKAKNFLEDNDEFEFGFLDFDDDDE